jgi:hypothetical protein
MKKNLSLSFVFLIAFTATFAQTQVCLRDHSVYGGSTLQCVDTADFNGDTFLDIASCSHIPGNNLNIFFGDNAGNFTPGPVLTGFVSWPRYLVSGDIDGDGDMDLMVAHNNTNAYSVVVNTGGGTFAAPAAVFCNQGSHCMVNCGDIDNDGDIDFAYATSPTSFILQNNGSGAFTEVAVGVSSDGYALAAGDLNNDGKPDLIMASHNDSVGVVMNTNSVPGVVSFANTVSYYKGVNGFFDMRHLTCRDLNGDNFKDVISSNYNSASISVFLGDGTGALSIPALYPVGYVHSTDAGDFNMDGNMDIANAIGSNVTILYGDGTGSFPVSAQHPTNFSGTASLRVADFDNDTRPDFVAAPGIHADSVTVFLNGATPPNTSVLSLTSGCAGSGIILPTGPGPLWYPGPTGGTGSPTPPAFPVVPGVSDYYVTHNATGDCESTRDTVRVTAYPGISSTVTYSNACDSTMFYVPFAVVGGTPPISYDWYRYSTGDNFSTTHPDTTVLITAVDTFYVDATDVNGCYTNNYIYMALTPSTDLYGVISSSTLGFINPGSVYAFQYLPNNSGFDTVAVVPTNALGEYTFPALIAGDYLIKVIADTFAYPTTVPTYYGDEFQWDSSVVFNHVCAQIDTADIQVIELAGGSGPGLISGYVVEGPGYGQRLMNPQLNPFMVPGGPLKGIDVKLGKNPSAGIQARTMTDTNGYYAFYNVPVGDYKIYVDIPNLPMDSLREVSILPGNDTRVQNNYFADSTHIYIDPFIEEIGLDEANALKTVVIHAFPNPASNRISVSVEMEKAGWFYSELIDLTGKKVLVTSQQKTQEGNNTFSINLTGIAKGVYTMNNYINTNRYTLKVVLIE